MCSGNVVPAGGANVSYANFIAGQKGTLAAVTTYQGGMRLEGESP